MEDIYLPNEKYDALVSKLLNLDTDAVTGEVSQDQIKIALGEVGDIWPERIADLSDGS